MEKKIYSSTHFSHILDSGKLKETIDQSIALLSAIEFDTLAFIGLSGATVAPIIAYQMGKELLMVRKNGGQDNSNSGMWIEGNYTAGRIVAVDDFICTGKTMSQMMHAIRHIRLRASDSETKIVAVLFHCVGQFENNRLVYRPKLHLPGDKEFATMIQTEERFTHPVDQVYCKPGLTPLFDQPDSTSVPLTLDQALVTLET